MSYLLMKLLKTQNGGVSEETMGGGKVKKSKHSVNVGLSEAQDGDVSQETVENVKVQKSPQKSTVLTNGETAMQSPNSESKKKKKKKRKMVNDSGPDAKKKTPKETENNLEKPDNEEDNREVPSLRLRLTGAFDDTSCASLSNLVNENTLKAIKEISFTNMTEIQHKTIRSLLEGRDLLAATKTGSVELTVKLKFMPTNRPGVFILSPTRELAMQIFGGLKELILTTCIPMAQKLANGINIIVATPGRLLDYMQNTPGFMYKNLQYLVIDEADRILDVGFEEELKQIIKLLPTCRHTMLLSATQTQKVEDLEPLYVGDDDKANATVDGLEQEYVVCPSEKRFLLPFAVLKKNRKKKVMVFFSSCMSVKYHYELLNYMNLPILAIHGKQKQNKGTTTFFQFCKADSGILLCMDVAARGLDIPEVDWIVQHDPLDDPKEYIHRVSRTARGLNGRGHALLILCPEEMGFLHYLKQSKFPLSEFDFSWSKISDIQSQLEKLIGKNYFLHKAAQEAYKSYTRVPPSVDLNINSNEGGGGEFGYQKTKKVEKSKIFKHISKKSSDSRQFSH
uniref:ATP-dependent RNA helicase n=1 Tax=Pan troglodytes TaxID=9598 RepID=A0A2I3TR95_PANTR